MILDKTNFDEGFALFSKTLKEVDSVNKADFIAFDLEMSGIKMDDNRSANDLPSEFYFKVPLGQSEQDGLVEVRHHPVRSVLFPEDPRRFGGIAI
jgi:hypothetical protein